MTSWEYKLTTTDKSFWSGKDKPNPEVILNTLGRDDWELVSVVPISAGAGTTSNLQFFFKRKRF